MDRAAGRLHVAVGRSVRRNTRARARDRIDEEEDVVLEDGREVLSRLLAAVEAGELEASPEERGALAGALAAVESLAHPVQ